ncbi:MAG: hypothetical protein PUC73_05990 [Lachnospiraceae bacterium]|nr:hypothetical protein [Lachnospiraceae bacterium]
MQEKLEQIMRQIYLMLSNCEESAYSSEDLIVPKKRIFQLLEELNYTVYDLMEQYEGTVAARDRGLAEHERRMAQIKEEAKGRAEDTYAASLLYAREMFMDMRKTTEELCKNLRREYDGALRNFEESLRFLHENEESTVAQLNLMMDAKKYLRLIEQQNKEKEQKQELSEEEKKRQEEIKAEQAELAAAEAASELNQKLAAPIVVQINEQPKVPEGFGKKQNKKKKYAPSQALEETAIEGEGVVTPSLPDADTLDGEYFEWKQEQEGTEKQAKKGGKKFFGKR